jgi:hypothetical protein
MNPRLRARLRATAARLTAVAHKSHAARIRARGVSASEPNDVEPVTQPETEVVIGPEEKVKSP